MSTHKEKLTILLKYKNLISNYGDKFITYFGTPLLIIYSLMTATICILAQIGAAHIELESDLFIQYPIFIPIIIYSINTMSILPIIAIIIYISYIIIKIFESHYIKMSKKEIK